MIRNSVDNFNAVSVLKILAIVYVLFVSFFTGSLIGQLDFQDPDSLLFYYLLLDVLLKLLAPLPFTLPAQYIFLPVKRKILVNYVLIITVTFSPFLLVALLYWFGYFQFNSYFSFVFFLKVLLLLSVSTLVTFNLKLNFFNTKGILLLVAQIALLALSLNYKYFNISTTIGFGLTLLALAYYLATKLVSIKISADDFNFVGVRRAILIEKIQVLSSRKSLFALEWKLVLRSKRPLTYLILSLLYIVIFFSILIETDKGSPFFGFILAGITSIVAIQYGQYCFSWEGSFMDFYFLNTNTRNYITSKMQFFYTLLILNFVILLPLILISDYSNIELIALCSIASIFHVSVTVPVIIFIGFFQRNKVNLEKGALLNYDGTSGAVFAIIFACLLPFGLLYLLLKLFVSDNYTGWVLLCISLIAVLKTDVIRSFLIRKLKKVAKYELIESFAKE